MTINEIQDEIIEEFSGLDDWMDKYQLLIDRLRDRKSDPLLSRERRPDREGDCESVDPCAL